MTYDIYKKKNREAVDGKSVDAKTSAKSRTGSASAGTRAVSSRSVSAGYSRVKSGELRRRNVTRTPDMSRPNAKVRSAAVSLGTLPAREKAMPVAGVHIEPKVRTVSEAVSNRKPFPLATVLMASLCTVLLLFMLFNMVKINNATKESEQLRLTLASLKEEEKDLKFELDVKNDLTVIEDIAKNKLGMVKLDQISKNYITMNREDKIETSSDK